MDINLQTFSAAEELPVQSAADTEPQSVGEEAEKSEDTAVSYAGTEARSADESKNEVTPAFIEALEGRIKMTAAENVKQQLLRDAEALRGVYPGFDLKRELTRSPEMRTLLGAGVPLRTAFEVTNLERIVGSAMEYAARLSARQTADSITAAPRTAENALSHRAASVRHRSVHSLSEKDIRDILSDVQNGMKVRF